MKSQPVTYRSHYCLDDNLQVQYISAAYSLRKAKQRFLKDPLNALKDYHVSDYGRTLILKSYKNDNPSHFPH